MRRARQRPAVASHIPSHICFYLWRLFFCFRRGEATCRHCSRNIKEPTYPPVRWGDIFTRLYHRGGGSDRHTNRHRHAYITCPLIPVHCCTYRLTPHRAYIHIQQNKHPLSHLLKVHNNSPHFCVTYLLWHTPPLHTHTHHLHVLPCHLPLFSHT